jgi:hypothetical protein
MIIWSIDKNSSSKSKLLKCISKEVWFKEIIRTMTFLNIILGFRISENPSFFGLIFRIFGLIRIRTKTLGLTTLNLFLFDTLFNLLMCQWLLLFQKTSEKWYWIKNILTKRLTIWWIDFSAKTEPFFSLSFLSNMIKHIFVYIFLHCVEWKWSFMYNTGTVTLTQLYKSCSNIQQQIDYI